MATLVFECWSPKWLSEVPTVEKFRSQPVTALFGETFVVNPSSTQWVELQLQVCEMSLRVFRLFVSHLCVNINVEPLVLNGKKSPGFLKLNLFM